MLQETGQSAGPSDDAIPSSNDLTVQARQFRLSKAAKQYLNGEITEERLQEFEKALEVDYAKAVLDHTSVLSEISRALSSALKKLVSGLSSSGTK
jgi:hypothetical protein